MPVFNLPSQLIFPPVHLSEKDGLLALHGDLSSERILLAYQNGIFPWYNEGEPIQWWSPNPRFVLFLEKLHISKSMQKLVSKKKYTLTMNQSFKEVIHHCKTKKRKGQAGTWITDDMEKAYIQLHHKGHAHSIECWDGTELIGGIYGLKINKVFCGESMFSLRSNASKLCMIHLVNELKKEGFKLIDCQVYSPHVESLGAELISREAFLPYLK